MEYLLKTKFQFAQENILLFRDDHPDPLRRPTRANISMGWQWLLGGVGPGDSLVFHYSGHGSQKMDYSGEELDGKNETLCPSDFQTAVSCLGCCVVVLWLCTPKTARAWSPFSPFLVRAGRDH